jgi:ribokinase
MAQAGEALAGIDADALVASADSALERDTAAAVRARTLLVTRGAGGGTWRSAGLQQDWDAAPVPGPGGDAYGCGDAFAAALTLALARRDALPRAVAFAAAEAAAMRGRDGAVGP